MKTSVDNSGSFLRRSRWSGHSGMGAVVRLTSFMAFAAAMAVGSMLIFVQVSQPMTAIGFMIDLGRIEWVVLVLELPALIATVGIAVALFFAFVALRAGRVRAMWAWILAADVLIPVVTLGAFVVLRNALRLSGLAPSLC